MRGKGTKRKFDQEDEAGGQRGLLGFFQRYGMVQFESCCLVFQDQSLFNSM